MKKALLVACCLLLLPFASFAGEKTLAASAEDMLALAEATINCTASEDACTQAEVIALKAAAVNGLRDIVGVVRDGNLNSMNLSPDHSLRRPSRLAVLKNRLAQNGIFQTTCNFGSFLIFTGVQLMIYGFYPSNNIFICLAGVLLLPFGCLVLLTCFFWWL